ncbi:hypothetical protein [Evansella tamaricis]|uniref:Uncharacterized protein n=1 Tax=Evansella tamaricis TaxID=2069301 RepID=A0ABS6JE28_9BACI|nr:hypothetical protein [Evansella tamaricis]MBU9711927.1 hypothetical protein [Evansella tamaricis]
MINNLFLIPGIVAIIFFLLSVLLFIFIDSPQPYFAGLFVAFVVFETVFFYRFTGKNKSQNRNLL